MIPFRLRGNVEVFYGKLVFEEFKIRKWNDAEQDTNDQFIVLSICHQVIALNSVFFLT